MKKNIIIKNGYGREIEYDAAVNLMDYDLTEEIHANMNNDMTEQEFFSEYVKQHERKFGETWELAKENPVW